MLLFDKYQLSVKHLLFIGTVGRGRGYKDEEDMDPALEMLG